MRLTKLALRNFRGVKEFTFDPDGKSGSIIGANKSGKTTVFDALCFLLFSKDSRGRSPKQFNIKTRKDGEIQHGLEHEVSGVFGDIGLRKVYKEKWSGRAGSSKRTLSGHTTDHYVNEVPVKESEFNDKISEVMSENMFKMLTDPTHFPERMHWNDRRAVLFEMSDTISDKDVIAGNPSLGDVLGILEGRTAEEQKKVLVEMRKNINKELDETPTRIDEASRQVDRPELSIEDAKDRVIQLESEIEKIDNRIADVKAGASASELRVKISELEAEMREFVNKADVKSDQALAQLRSDVQDASKELYSAEQEQTEATNKYSSAKEKLGDALGIKESLKKEIEETRDKPDDETCPYCDQPIKGKGKAHKAEHLKELKRKLTEWESAGKELQIEHDSVLSKINKAEDVFYSAKKNLDDAKAKLEKAEAVQPDPKQSKEYKKLEEKMSAMRDKLGKVDAEKYDKISELEGQKSGIKEKISAMKTVMDKHRYADQAKVRMAELRDRQFILVRELESAEEQLELVSAFTRARASMVEKSVNKKFDGVEWQLFSEQINGELAEVCEAWYDGNSYTSELNHAGRVQCGLKIIEGLSNHFGVEAPVFVDDRNVISELPKTKLQVISLVVDPKQKELKVSIEK